MSAAPALPDFPRPTVVVLGGAGHLGLFVANELSREGGAETHAWRVVAQGRRLAAFDEAGRIEARVERVVSPVAPFTDELKEAIVRARAIVVCLPIQLAALVAASIESAINPAKSGLPRVVAFSSTRRHSRVPDASVAEVIAGEARWVASPLKPILLRATMIFGDARDRNLARVFSRAREGRWTPAPIGRVGKAQPVFALDLAKAVRAALDEPASILDQLPPDRAIELAGPEPVELRELLRLCYEAVGSRPRIAPVPTPLLKLAALASPLLPASLRVSRAQVARLAEEKTVDLEPARRLLGYSPTPLVEALAEKARLEAESLARVAGAGQDGDELSA